MSYSQEDLLILGRRSAEFDNHYKSIEHQRTLLGGTMALRNAGEIYLPKEEDESITAYTARKNRSFLQNVYKKTLNKLVGEVFSKEVVASNDMPQTLMSWMTDVDLNGNNITIFLSEVSRIAFHAGYCGVYCDYSNVNGNFFKENGRSYYQNDAGETLPVNIKAQKENGWRPYLRVIDPDTITRVTIKREGGKWYYGEIVVVEEIQNEERDLIFDERVLRMQIFSIGKIETYIQRTDTKNHTFWEGSEVVETGLDFIPLHFLKIGTEKMGDVCVRSELEDLGWLNICHWQSASDQRNVLHYARLITYFGKMLDDSDVGKKITVGTNVMIHSSDPDGDMKIIEHSGEAMEAGDRDIKTLDAQMHMFGLQMQMPKVDRETATGKMIDTSESDSILKSWALKIDQFANLLLVTMYKYGKSFVDAEDNNGLDVETIGKLTVNTELKSIFSVSFIDLILRAKQDGVISDKVAAREMQRRNLISGDINTDEMVDEIRKMEAEKVKVDVENKKKEFEQVASIEEENNENKDL